MADWREVIPVDVLAVDAQVPHGDIKVCAAPTGEPGFISAETACQIERSGDRLAIRQESGWPTDLEIALPSAVRELRLSTGHGDVEAARVDVDLEVQTGRGSIRAASGGRGVLSTGSGDVRVGAWRGPLRVDTGRGDLEVDAALGGLEAKTGKGDVRVGQAAGRVEATTGKGNLVLGRLTGDATLHTGKGDIVVTDAAGARVVAETSRGNVALDGGFARLRVRVSHGDVSCRFPAPAEDSEVVTDRGNLHVELTGESPLRIEAITGHGRVESTLPLVRVGRPGPAGAFSQRYVASLGGTNPIATLRLYSAHGDLWIGRSGEAARPVDPSQPTEAYDFARSATARAWAETLRDFPGEGIAREMAALGETIGQRVGETVDQAMRRLKREMERLEAELERDQAKAEAEDEREERLAEEDEEREERLAEEEEEREERLAEEERRAEEEEAREEALAEAREVAQEARRQAEELARAAGPVPPTPPRPHSPPRRPEARPAPDTEMAVLEAVSRGEISVDEAMVLLSSLEAQRSGR